MFAFASSFRRFARRRIAQLNREDAAASQDRQLRQLVRIARNTQFGKDHGFAKFRNLDDYRQNVPLRTWEQLARDYWASDDPTLKNRTWPAAVAAFAVTSGTEVGRCRPIPCTTASLDSRRVAVRDVLVQHLAHRPDSTILGRKICLLTPPPLPHATTEGRAADALHCILRNQWSWFARRRFLTSRKLSRIADGDARAKLCARLAVRKKVRTVGGTPQVLLPFFEELASAGNDGSIAASLPDLELVTHTGVNFSPYRKRFEKLLQGTRAELRETYSATEALLAVADGAPGVGLRLVTDRGVFFEFVPVGELRSKSPTRHWVANVEPDVQYAVVLTTNAGLWSYVLDDTVRFVGTKPPRILVTGRVSQMLSVFGENVVGEELDEALTAATSSVGKRVVEFTVGSEVPPSPRKPGRHVIVAEFSDAQPPNKKQITAISRIIDDRIQQRNDPYRKLRGGDYGMRMPKVEIVPPGTFAAWMQSLGRHKVPRVIHNPEMLDELRSFAELSDSRDTKTAA